MESNEQNKLMRKIEMWTRDVEHTDSYKWGGMVERISLRICMNASWIWTMEKRLMWVRGVGCVEGNKRGEYEIGTAVIEKQ